MKAVLCKAFGPPEDLVLEDIPAPEPGPGEVLVDVHASALNFPEDRGTVNRRFMSISDSNIPASIGLYFYISSSSRWP